MVLLEFSVRLIAYTNVEFAQNRTRGPERTIPKWRDEWSN